jgi:hypothetical protein
LMPYSAAAWWAVGMRRRDAGFHKATRALTKTRSLPFDVGERKLIGTIQSTPPRKASNPH